MRRRGAQPAVLFVPAFNEMHYCIREALMTIDSTRIVKETIYVAIMVVTMGIGAWLTTSRIQWPLILAVAAVYLVIRLVVPAPNSQSRS